MSDGIIKGIDELRKVDPEFRKRASVYLTLEPGQETVVRFLDDKNEVVITKDHWIQKVQRYVSCRSLEGVCPACEDEDSQTRRTTTVLYANVYDYNAKKVMVLRLRGGEYYGFESYVIEDEDTNVRDYKVKVVDPVGNQKRPHFQLLPIDKEKSRNAEIPDVKKIDLTTLVLIPTEDFVKKLLEG